MFPFPVLDLRSFVEYGGGATRESQNCTHHIPQETVQNLGGHDFLGVFMFFVADASRVLLKGLMIPLGRQ